MYCDFCLKEKPAHKVISQGGDNQPPRICADCVMAIDQGTYQPPKTEPPPA